VFHNVLRDYKNLGHVFTRVYTYFVLWAYVKDGVFVPPLPRDLAELKARIIAAVKTIDAPLLTRGNIVSMCAMSPVVHTSIISSCQKKNPFLYIPVAVNNSIKAGPLVFLL